MKPIPILPVADAIDSGGEDMTWFLDVETGVVDFWHRELSEWGEDDDEEPLPLFDIDPERYRVIPSETGRDGYRRMERFIAGLDPADEDVANQLEVAISGRGAFRRFKDVLGVHPDLRARWFALVRADHIERATEWLEGQGLEAADPPVVAEVPEPAPAPAPPKHEPGLIDLLVFGGAPELHVGDVVRSATLSSEGEARRMFKRVARHMCGWHGIGWRKRFVTNTSCFELEGWSLSCEGREVTLRLPMQPAPW